MSTHQRATTLQQKFGFADSDLKSSKHDDIMFWLDGMVEKFIMDTYDAPSWDAEVLQAAEAEEEKYLSELLPRINREFSDANQRLDDILEAEKTGKGENKWLSLLGQSTKEWNMNEVLRLARQIKSIEDRQGKMPPSPDKPSIKITKREWEYAIVTGNSSNPFTVGFVDMLVTFKSPKIYRREHSRSDGLPSEWGIDWNSCFVRQYHPYREHSYGACFEAKTEIPSLGELIRQIRMYQTYVEYPFFIVCPDDKFKDALAAQGIGFIKYTG